MNSRPSTSPAATDSRLTDLETRLAHHERMAEEMSEVIARQQGEIDRLTILVRRLVERLREVEADRPPSPQDDKPPPHY